MNAKHLTRPYSPDTTEKHLATIETWLARIAPLFGDLDEPQISKIERLAAVTREYGIPVIEQPGFGGITSLVVGRGCSHAIPLFRANSPRPDLWSSHISKLKTQASSGQPDRTITCLARWIELEEIRRTHGAVVAVDPVAMALLAIRSKGQAYAPGSGTISANDRTVTRTEISRYARFLCDHAEALIKASESGIVTRLNRSDARTPVEWTIRLVDEIVTAESTPEGKGPRFKQGSLLVNDQAICETALNSLIGHPLAAVASSQMMDSLDLKIIGGGNQGRGWRLKTDALAPDRLILVGGSAN